jgi:protein TonB
MIARAETSTNAQSPQAEKSVSKGMSVALIGPNDAHRKIVARALASTQGRKVHEFIDYPDKLNDLPHIVEQNFDVVLVDVDTDESYALQIIEKLAEIGQSVMAYSARTDQELLMSCMRAGARDFLPLPTENAPEASRAAEPAPQPAARPAATAAPQAAPRAAEPKPAPLPPVPTVRSNITPIIPEKRIEPAAEAYPARVKEEHRDPELAHVIEEITLPTSLETSVPEKATSDFAAWDAVNLRPAPVPPAVKRPEARPRPALVPERKKSEAAPRVVPSLDASAAPAIERPPVSVDLFRSSQSQVESEPDEAAEKQGANWIKWILIAAGPVVLALVLLVVFTRPSAPNPAATQTKVASAPVQPETQATAEPIATTAAKPTAGAPAAKPAPGSADTPDAPTQSVPVSSDAMAAQLVAPTRIAGQIKKSAPADEPPPSAPTPVGLEDNNVVPGAVFGGANKVKVAPHVVAISAGVADGMILRKTAPVYPKFAQEAHITGKVVLKATITKQGTIEGVQVVSGPKILAPSAVDAVKTWKYKPYTLDNQPVAVETNITVVFGTVAK